MCYVTEVLVNRIYLKMPTVSVYSRTPNNITCITGSEDIIRMSLYICSLSVKYFCLFGNSMKSVPSD